MSPPSGTKASVNASRSFWKKMSAKFSVKICGIGVVGLRRVGPVGHLDLAVLAVALVLALGVGDGLAVGPGMVIESSVSVAPAALMNTPRVAFSPARATCWAAPGGCG